MGEIMGIEEEFKLVHYGRKTFGPLAQMCIQYRRRHR